MTLRPRSDFRLQLLFCAALSFSCLAQQPADTGNPQARPPDQSAQQAPVQSQPAVQQKQQQPPPQEPYIIEDGGLSIEPIYWLNRAQPDLHGGAAATSFESIGYSGHANPGIGGEIAIPAGRSNTLRFSYFRIQGNANSTASQDVTLFGEAYNAGDYLTQNYRLQSAKISWDYLGYTWDKPRGKIRLKTLYEVQYVTISTTIAAPLKAVTTDSSGNLNSNIANGSKNLIYPTFGLELEQALGSHFRWEVKGSGFGIPHRGDIWDAQANLALRMGEVEFLAGGKAFHFKTSPQSEQYFADTLSGAFVGLRYYWGRRQ